MEQPPFRLQYQLPHGELFLFIVMVKSEGRALCPGKNVINPKDLLPSHHFERMLLGELTDRKRLMGLISSNKEVLLAVMAKIIPQRVCIGRCLGDKVDDVPALMLLAIMGTPVCPVLSWLERAVDRNGVQVLKCHDCLCKVCCVEPQFYEAFLMLQDAFICRPIHNNLFTTFP